MQTDTNDLPILDQFSAEGFVDLVFQIADFIADDEKYRFHLTASHKGKVVGMNVEIVKGIQGGLFEDENEEVQLLPERVYYKGIKFSRSGLESDRLISVLAGLYELSADNLRMVEDQSFTVIALHEGSLDFDSHLVNMKLFANDTEDSNEEDYFESFFNVDFANSTAFWNEKDQDYREPLIKGLSA